MNSIDSVPEDVADLVERETSTASHKGQRLLDLSEEERHVAQRPTARARPPTSVAGRALAGAAALMNFNSGNRQHKGQQAGKDVSQEMKGTLWRTMQAHGADTAIISRQDSAARHRHKAQRCCAGTRLYCHALLLQWYNCRSCFGRSQRPPLVEAGHRAVIFSRWSGIQVRFSQAIRLDR